jgi:hypothetical protein
MPATFVAVKGSTDHLIEGLVSPKAVYIKGKAVINKKAIGNGQPAY